MTGERHLGTENGAGDDGQLFSVESLQKGGAPMARESLLSPYLNARDCTIVGSEVGIKAKPWLYRLPGLSLFIGSPAL